LIHHAQYLNTTIPGAFSNGTNIPDGEYRLFLKMLKIFGRPDDPEDSETYLSPIVVKIPAPPSNKTATSLCVEIPQGSDGFDVL